MDRSEESQGMPGTSLSLYFPLSLPLSPSLPLLYCQPSEFPTHGTMQVLARSDDDDCDAGAQEMEMGRLWVQTTRNYIVSSLQTCESSKSLFLINSPVTESKLKCRLSVWPRLASNSPPPAFLRPASRVRCSKQVP